MWEHFSILSGLGSSPQEGLYLWQNEAFLDKKFRIRHKSWSHFNILFLPFADELFQFAHFSYSCLQSLTYLVNLCMVPFACIGFPNKRTIDMLLTQGSSQLCASQNAFQEGCQRGSQTHELVASLCRTTLQNWSPRWLHEWVLECQQRLGLFGVDDIWNAPFLMPPRSRWHASFAMKWSSPQRFGRVSNMVLSSIAMPHGNDSSPRFSLHHQHTTLYKRLKW
jgi:hypothetical protein